MTTAKFVPIIPEVPTVFTASETSTRSLSVPDSAAGPGQSLDLPADNGAGLPLSLNDAEAVLAVTATLVYDPDLLVITGVELSSALPSDWQGAIASVRPGQVTLSLSGTTALSGVNVDLAFVQAQIPEGVTLGGSQTLTITEVALTGTNGAIAAQGDTAIHQVGFRADLDGDSQYSAQDSVLAARLLLGLDNTSLSAFPLSHLQLLADVTGNGSLSALDAALIARAVAGAPGSGLPPLPPEPSLPFVTVIASGDATEGALEAGAFIFTRVGNLTQPLTVNYAIAGTATPGSDYQTLPQSITFAANQSSVTLAVTPLEDTLVEPPETVVVTLGPGPDYAIALPSTATATLTSDDAEPPPNTGFNIEFDYRFDSTGFFNTQETRAALEAAADIWEGLIQDEFADVPAGISFSVTSPSQRSQTEAVTLNQSIDDLLIFVGADATLTGSGNGGFTGTNAIGDFFNARIADNFRGVGPVTNFEPWAGSISFNPTLNWNFSLTPNPSQPDFISTALHEIGHVLGIGTSPIFRQIAAGNQFDGPNALAANSGSPIPLERDLTHVVEGFRNNTVLLDPILGPGRHLPSAVDLALLADIGYQVPDFIAQGITPALTTPSNDTVVFGTIGADVLDGLAGDDQLQGDNGDDTLLGGAGNDVLIGQLGDDSLDGGPGNDQLVGNQGRDRLRFGVTSGADQILDFELTQDVIQVAPELGFSSGAAVFATLSRPFTNVSRFTLSPGNTVDIFHDILPINQTPLTAANFVIG